jgi:hypothetical protein
VLTVSGSTGIISVLFSDTPKVASNVSKKHIPAYFISGNFGNACLAWILEAVADEGEAGIEGIEN